MPLYRYEKTQRMKLILLNIIVRYMNTKLYNINIWWECKYVDRSYRICSWAIFGETDESNYWVDFPAKNSFFQFSVWFYVVS